MLHPTGKNEVDLLLVCGARPSLIEQTLESFSSRVFSNFQISNIFANIDKFMGGSAEVLQVEEIIKGYFPDAVIRKPRDPSFTDAVIWLWQSAQSPIVLHLEDDWVANTDIQEEMVLPYFTERTRQVSFLTKEKNWPIDRPFHCKWNRRKVLGFNFGKTYFPDEPIFTTSPSFLERGFAHHCASLMIPNNDPEKQLYDGLNPNLTQFTKNYQNRLISNGSEYMIKDIGRSYRDQHGYEKSIVDGSSIWTVPS